jgi:hypothetical protein
MSNDSTEAWLQQLADKAARATVDLLDAKALPPRKRYLRVDAASDFIGVDKVTMGNWRSQGIGPRFRRLGARIIYEVDELVRFVEQSPLYGSGKLDGGA